MLRILLLTVALIGGLAGTDAARPAGPTATAQLAPAARMARVARVARPQSSQAPGYQPPLDLVVVRGFSPPAVRYGPGHLGVDLEVSPNELVRAAGDGVVRFAGRVAGRGVVVIVHPDGISTEYEPVRPLVRVGAPVARGDPIATVDGVHRGCPVAHCLHWGARRGVTYLDPLSLLRALGPVRLLPWEGS